MEPVLVGGGLHGTHVLELARRRRVGRPRTSTEEAMAELRGVAENGRGGADIDKHGHRVTDLLVQFTLGGNNEYLARVNVVGRGRRRC